MSSKQSHIQFEGEPDFRILDNNRDEKADKNDSEPHEESTVAGTTNGASNQPEGEDDNTEQEDGEAEDDDFASAWEVLDLANASFSLAKLERMLS